MNPPNEHRPGTFRVQRIRRIQAPPERIFALIEDLRRWPARLEIVEAAAPYRMKIMIAGRNTAELRLAAEGDSTLLTWTMNGSTAFLTRVFHFLFQMDRLLRKEFENACAAS